MTTNTNRPALPDYMLEHFAVFGVRTIYPARITTTIATDRGNVLLAEGELTWGGSARGESSVMVWSPNHYAGVDSSSVLYGVELDYDSPVSVPARG